MNLALQKRNEQLERWRQNEAINTSDNQPSNKSKSQIPTSQIPSQKSSSRSPMIIREPKSGTKDGPTRTDVKSGASTIVPRRQESDTGSNFNKTSKKTNSNSSVKFTNSTLFLTACSNGDLEEAKRLIEDKSVDINVMTCDGLTGLHEAAICGNEDMLVFLISQGANINCCDYEGWTPLHAASSLGKQNIVQLLIQHGADATIVNCENLLALDLARNDEVRALIGEYLKDHDIDSLRCQEERAIENDIDRWLEYGNYEERSHPITNASVLHVIAAKGYVTLLKKILKSPTLKKQINLEARDNEGFTPLLAASFWSQAEIVEILIEHGANVMAQANNGYKISSIHLQNYQDSKINQSRSLASIDSRRSTSTIDSLSSNADLGYADDNGSVSISALTSGSVPKHLKQGHLLKSNSLDISQHASDTSALLSSSMSVDRLLLRSESMTERELRRSYKDLVMENERLRKHLKSLDDREKQSQQERIRQERQLLRKISELEEENKQLEHWKEEMMRLKDENTSLVRVVSKLSRQH